MSKKLDDWTKFQIDTINKKINEKTYCQLCGKEIILFSGEHDRYKYEIREEAHIDCISRYKEEMRQRRSKEQEDKE